MKLRRVVIEGYRSIRGPLELFIDPTSTIILGANDHGKTNILLALTHLNPDQSFTPDDLNWNLRVAANTLPADLPRITYELTLDSADQEQIIEGQKHYLDLIESGEITSYEPGDPESDNFVPLTVGFTHFFTLKTILHAREIQHPANSHIYLFDEPGVYLHPSG
jgi:predicted ATP-dependent endonuclease of OLD family